MSTWYYMSNDNERIGPLEDAAMHEAIASNHVQPGSLVFKIGNSEWRRAQDFSELTRYATDPIATTPRITWSVKNVLNDDGSWGSEIRFPGASANEFKIISGLLQQYAAIKSPLIPKVSITADRTGLLFLFTLIAGKPAFALVNGPIRNDEGDLLRTDLLRTAEILHGHGLGLWTVDRQLLFRVSNQFLMIPAIWLPAFTGRDGIVSGAAPEWRISNSQPQADIYAIAYACFTAVTGKEYDPTAKTLPSYILPAAKPWDNVLVPALQKNVVRRPKHIAEWLALYPVTLASENGAGKTGDSGHVILENTIRYQDKVISNKNDKVETNLSERERNSGNSGDGLRQKESFDISIIIQKCYVYLQQRLGTRLLIVSVAALMLLIIIGGVFYLSPNHPEKGGVNVLPNRVPHEVPPQPSFGVSGEATRKYWQQVDSISKEAWQLFAQSNNASNPNVQLFGNMLVLYAVINSLDSLSTNGVDPRACQVVGRMRECFSACLEIAQAGMQLQQRFGNRIPDNERMRLGLALVAVFAEAAMIQQAWNNTARELSRDYGGYFVGN